MGRYWIPELKSSHIALLGFQACPVKIYEDEDTIIFMIVDRSRFIIYVYIHSKQYPGRLQESTEVARLVRELLPLSFGDSA